MRLEYVYSKIGLYQICIEYENERCLLTCFDMRLWSWALEVSWLQRQIFVLKEDVLSKRDILHTFVFRQRNHKTTSVLWKRHIFIIEAWLFSSLPPFTVERCVPIFQKYNFSIHKKNYIKCIINPKTLNLAISAPSKNKDMTPLHSVLVENIFRLTVWALCLRNVTNTQYQNSVYSFLRKTMLHNWCGIHGYPISCNDWYLQYEEDKLTII